ncbi:hypothetical protein D3C73_1336020 [compost metagenome]
MQLHPLVNVTDTISAGRIRAVIIQHLGNPLVIDLLIAVVFNGNEHGVLLSNGGDDDLSVFLHIFDPVDNGILDQRLERNLRNQIASGLRCDVPDHTEHIIVPVLLQLNIGAGMLQLLLQCDELPTPAQTDFHQLG